MTTYVCIDKEHEDGNKARSVLNYRLEDMEKRVIEISANDLKHAIRNGEIDVLNLKLASNNRLITDNRRLRQIQKEEHEKPLTTVQNKSEVNFRFIELLKRNFYAHRIDLKSIQCLEFTELEDDYINEKLLIKIGADKYVLMLVNYNTDGYRIKSVHIRQRQVNKKLRTVESTRNKVIISNWSNQLIDKIISHTAEVAGVQ